MPDTFINLKAERLSEAAAFLAHLLWDLRQRPATSWKNLVNRALLADQRLPWEPDAFDTFTDHLFDLLVEAGVLQAPDMRTPLPVLNPAPTPWEAAFQSGVRVAARQSNRPTFALLEPCRSLARTALLRTLATYGPSSGKACA